MKWGTGHCRDCRHAYKRYDGWQCRALEAARNPEAYDHATEREIVAWTKLHCNQSLYNGAPLYGPHERADWPCPRWLR